jgi:hypothetical protein
MHMIGVIRGNGLRMHSTMTLLVIWMISSLNPRLMLLLRTQVPSPKRPEGGILLTGDGFFLYVLLLATLTKCCTAGSETVRCLH